MPSLLECFDENFDVNLDTYFELRRKRRLEEEEEDEDEDDRASEEQKKRHRKRRNYGGYDPQEALSSEWYRRYVSNVRVEKNKKHYNRFRRRFRIPYANFLQLVKDARDENWFPEYEKPNALGQPGIPLEVFILGSLRYLGWTFDDIGESTGVSEEAHRLFFKKFVKACRKHLYPKWVKRPQTDEEVADCMAEFVEAGFDGCIGSADVTHIILEKCQARLKNQNLGGKSSHTTRAFQLVVNHRRQIIASTVGFPGRWNDQTVVRFDDFILDIQRGKYLENNEFVLHTSEGDLVKYNGSWVLVDGGYPTWTTLICPFKDTTSIKEQRWSRWAESMRKDVECAFGIMKGLNNLLPHLTQLLYKLIHLMLFNVGRWRILKTGIRLHGIAIADDIWFTCCAFHNMLLNVDGLDKRWKKGVKSDFEGELGWHAPGDVETYCSPLIFRRVSSGRQGQPVRAFDASTMGNNTTNVIPEEGHMEHEIIIGKKRNLLSITNKNFRNLLVTSFHKKWELGKVKWPSRTGKMAN